MIARGVSGTRKLFLATFKPLEFSAGHRLPCGNDAHLHRVLCMERFQTSWQDPLLHHNVQGAWASASWFHQAPAADNCCHQLRPLSNYQRCPSEVATRKPAICRRVRQHQHEHRSTRHGVLQFRFLPSAASFFIHACFSTLCLNA